MLAGWVCVMYLANAWMPPYRDDYWAALVWGTGDHLQNMGDVVRSLERYYMLHGGRLVSFFIQFVFMMYGKVWFNIANAFVFAAMCAVILMHCRRDTSFADEPEMLFVIGAFMWFGISHFGEIAIWLCGSAVYLWTGLLTAVFLLPYNLALAGKLKGTHFGLAILMLPLGAIAACSVENLTVRLPGEHIDAGIFRSGWGRELWVRSSEASFVSSRPGITSASWRIRIVRGCSICSINFLRIWK